MLQSRQSIPQRWNRFAPRRWRPTLPTSISTAPFPNDALNALAAGRPAGRRQRAGGRRARPRLPRRGRVVERLARECGSTAMVVCMHYCGTAVLEAHGPRDVRTAAASGAHLTTLAFSEAGSRSHFWAPVGTAKRDGDRHRARRAKELGHVGAKATATSGRQAGQADGGLSTLWLVPADTPGFASRGPSTASACAATTRRRSPPRASASRRPRCSARTARASTS